MNNFSHNEIPSDNGQLTVNMLVSRGGGDIVNNFSHNGIPSDSFWGDIVYNFSHNGIPSDNGQLTAKLVSYCY